MDAYNFYQETIINLGSKQVAIRVHNNAPFVVNFYIVKSGRKIYNHNQDRMKFTNLTDNWLRDTMNMLWGSDKKVYYNANF